MDKTYIKKQIEEKFEIPYEEFCELEPETITELIESKIGKELKPDDRPIIDGILIDKKHIITRKDIDRKINKITQNRLQKVIKKFKIR